MLRLAISGAELLVKTLEGYANETITPIPQDHSGATYAPLLKKQDGHIRWHQPAEKLDAFIRGMTPWPGAYAYHNENRLKILKAAVIPQKITEPPGTVLRAFPDELRVATGKGALSLMEIQAASQKRLLIKDFLRGYRILPDDVLT